MKYLLLFPMLLIACEHKTKCPTSTFTYQKVQNPPAIADIAANDMRNACGGAYNIEQINQNDKNITYTYSCPEKCR